MNSNTTENSERITDSTAEKERLEKIKCVVVGDGGSGKTSLLTVYAKGEFPEVSTIVMVTRSLEITKIHQQFRKTALCPTSSKNVVGHCTLKT